MQITEEHAQEVTVHERRIEQTREAMGETISQLREQVSPGTLAGNAGNAVKEATVGKTGEWISSLTDRVKANPIPAALVGASVAWLWMGGRKDGGSRPYYRSMTSGRGVTSGRGITSGPGVSDSVSSKVGDAADQLSDKVGDVTQSARDGIDQVGQQVGQVGQQVGYQAQRVQSSFQRMLEENPLPVALVAAGLGALMAAAVPTSQAEERVLQPVGDQLSEQAKKVGEKASRVADRAGTAAKEEAQH